MVDLKASVSLLYDYSMPQTPLEAPVSRTKHARASTATKQTPFRDSDFTILRSRERDQTHEMQQEIPSLFDDRTPDPYERYTGDQGTITFKPNCMTFRKSTFTLQLPVWFLSRRFELRFRRLYGGWDHNLRVYRMVPFDAPIFTFCFKGQVEKVQELFSAGLASPFDSDPDGNTPLHVRTSVA